MTKHEVEEIMQRAVRHPVATSRTFIEGQGLEVISVAENQEDHSATWDLRDRDGRQWKAEIAHAEITATT